MSRQAKIIILSLILGYSIYLYQNDVSIINRLKETRTENIKSGERLLENAKKRETRKENKPRVKKTESSDNAWNIYSKNDYTAVPKNGFSPYDNVFGKGIYKQTENYVEVSAPLQSHIVFILIDSYSGRRVRNEFIRRGEKFRLTKIPYGTYDYMYFSGRNWDSSKSMNNGKIKGGFRDYQGFSKNQNFRDRMEFERGYYGGYTLKLTQEINGNLKTDETTENDFFN